MTEGGPVGASATYKGVLALMMVVTGTLNTILTKNADTACAKGVSYADKGQTADDNPCDDRTNGSHPFDHPFVQALAMFVGEFLCMLAYRIYILFRKTPKNEEALKPYNPFIFLVPSACDCLATSTMYVGLTMTYASQFQMLRGSVIIFTGLLSRIFLGRNKEWHKWIGMILVLIGLVFVGLAAFLTGSSGSTAPNPILGDALIIAAQLVVAVQMVVEEKFLGQYNVPALMAVGWEGVFGLMIMSVMCIIFFYIPGPRAGGTFENINDAILQMEHNTYITGMVCGMICSIAFFNFSGVSVTKTMSATTRMVLDSIRTITIWAYGLAVKSETFSYIQVIGFVFLILGTFVFNDILVAPALRKFGILKSPAEKTPLLVNAET